MLDKAVCSLCGDEKTQDQVRDYARGLLSIAFATGPLEVHYFDERAKVRFCESCAGFVSVALLAQ